MRTKTPHLQPQISISHVIRNAIVFNFNNWQGGLLNPNNLLQTVPRLFALLDEREIEYLLVGGIALLQYVRGRNSEEINLIMALSSLKKVPEIELISQDINFARGQFEGLQIDFLLTRNRLFDKVRRNYATMRPYVERDIRCATVEGLLLLKLYALPSLYRQFDFSRVGLYENDIATLMQHYQPALEPLFDELALHLSETDLVSVREIVDEIEQRIARFQKGFGKN